MGKTIRAVLIAAAFFSCFPSAGRAAVYEASSLFNSVGRSETVQDLFFERWDTILERQLYVDWYGKINWINNFKINTVNGATGATQAVPMTLVRTYGSLTVDYPVLGGYDAGDVSKRLSKGSSSEKGAGEPESAESDGGLLKPKNLQVAFTMTGFHYGITRKTTVDRGTAGEDTVTDYRFTQFFDDMFVISLIYTPYIYVHGGLLINNQIDPNADGTMSYGKSRDGYPQLRWFFASNLLSFLNTNATFTKGKIEKVAAGTEVVKLVELLTKVPKYVPRLTVTGKQLCLFNDEGYDAVWVKSAYIRGTPTHKGEGMNSSDQQHAKLYTLSFLITEDLGNIIFADYFTEFQYCPDTLIEKRTVTASDPAGKSLKLDPLREMRGSLGINFLGFFKERVDSLKLQLGLGRYWDPAIAVQRTDGSGYALLGYFGSLKYEHPFFGAEVSASYNYSKELRKLVEAADKLAIEGSVFIRF